MVGQDDCDCPGDKYICTDCGDGTCQEWENPCSCNEDCPFGENECKENGGECSPACPPGHAVLDLGGCPDDAFCCAIDEECLGEGMVGKNMPGTPPCCGDLEPIPVTIWIGGSAESECYDNEEELVCSDCGNGICETWESWCTCDEDCEKIENLCVEDGHSCKNFCPEGWTPNGVPGCAPGEKCCEENIQDCLGAGEGFDDIWPQDIGCCEGLGMIENLWMGEDGDCVSGPGIFCSECGNWECEPWENECNCPNDCGIMPPEWCDPSGSDSTNCPGAAFCAACYNVRGLCPLPSAHPHHPTCS